MRGVSLAPGIAIGRACFLQLEAPCFFDRVLPEYSEAARLIKALALLVERLAQLAQNANAQLGSQVGDIFLAHRLIIEDQSLQQFLLDLVERDGLGAEQAVEKAFSQYQRELQACSAEHLRERAADLDELKTALLVYLRQQHFSRRCKDRRCSIDVCHLQHDHILIAKELTPALAVEVDAHTVGFLVERGARNSHAAILARALNLPTLSGFKDLFRTVPLDAECLIDGDAGELILNPERDTLRAYRRTLASIPPSFPVADPVPGVTVMATIDRLANVAEAVAAKAEGIGLTRTEMVAMAKGGLPSESEQEVQYREIVEALAGKPVYIRLWDLGCDKTPLSAGPRAVPPTEGCRGARLLLRRPELLRTQARALVRASHHQPIRVVYPMVTDTEQYQQLRALFQKAVADLPEGALYHGIMFEVPSACLQANELFDLVDFGCIGSNDLTQYLFAADRAEESDDFERLFDHPLLWRAIDGLVRAAEAANKPLSMCGELASNPRFTRRILDAGVSTLSASPRRIASVRHAALQV